MRMMQLFHFLHCMTLNRITDKNDIVTDVYSKEFVGTGRKNLSFQHMIDIVNKLE